MQDCGKASNPAAVVNVSSVPSNMMDSRSTNKSESEQVMLVQDCEVSIQPPVIKILSMMDSRSIHKSGDCEEGSIQPGVIHVLSAPSKAQKASSTSSTLTVTTGNLTNSNNIDHDKVRRDMLKFYNQEVMRLGKLLEQEKEKKEDELFLQPKNLNDLLKGAAGMSEEHQQRKRKHPDVQLKSHNKKQRLQDEKINSSATTKNVLDKQKNTNGTVQEQQNAEMTLRVTPFGLKWVPISSVGAWKGERGVELGRLYPKCQSQDGGNKSNSTTLPQNQQDVQIKTTVATPRLQNLKTVTSNATPLLQNMKAVTTNMTPRLQSVNTVTSNVKTRIQNVKAVASNVTSKKQDLQVSLIGGKHGHQNVKINNSNSGKTKYDNLYAKCRIQESEFNPKVIMHRLQESDYEAWMPSHRQQDNAQLQNIHLEAQAADDLPMCSHCNGTGRSSRPPLVSIQVQTIESRLETPRVTSKPHHLNNNPMKQTEISLNLENIENIKVESDFRINESSLELCNETTYLIEIDEENPEEILVKEPEEILVENPSEILVENPPENKVENFGIKASSSQKLTSPLTYTFWRTARGDVRDRLFSPLLRRTQFGCPLCNEVVGLNPWSVSRKLKNIQNHLSTHLYYNIKEDKILLNEKVCQPVKKLSDNEEICQRDEKIINVNGEMSQPYEEISVKNKLNGQLYKKIYLPNAPDKIQHIGKSTGDKSEQYLESLPEISLKSTEKCHASSRLTDVKEENHSNKSSDLLPSMETAIATVSSLARECEGEVLLIQDGCFYTDLVQPSDFSWTCNICNIKFMDCKDFNAHTQAVHPNIINNFALKAKVVKKKKKPLEKKTLICKICGNIYATKEKLQYHINLHKNKEAYQCDICKKNLSSPKSLKFHKRIHIHGSSDYRSMYPYHKGCVCDVCGKYYVFAYLLKKHKIVAHGADTANSANSFLCSKCPKTFDSLGGLRGHESRIHQPSLGINDHNGMKRWRLKTQKTNISTDKGNDY